MLIGGLKKQRNKVMKANAPEKLYGCYKGNGNLFVDYRPFPNEESIEYTRTDAFIEKAVKWLSANVDKYIWYSDYAENIGDDTCGMNDDFIEDFKKYMKD